MTALTPPAPSVALDSTPSQTVELLPDPLLPALARPLSIVGDHTYAAIWPYVRRPGAPRPIARELIFVRDDGHLVIRSAEGSAPPELQLPLPNLPPLPEDRLWSSAGLQSYLAGDRPEPADVFRRLVAVLNQFVDFTGSLDEPALMAEFFATYLLTTWFSPAFPILGLLWITGDHGAGKSRLLALLARLAHFGLFLPVPPPPTALRALAGLGASLAVDDANFLGQRSRAFNWTSSSSHALLLAGRQRGALVTVTQVEPGSARGSRHTRQLDVSGPRIFAAVHQPQPAIAGYFLVVPLVRTADVALAAADAADPAAWPAGITLRALVDDLWALSLSRLRDLPPHLPLVAQAAADFQPQDSYLHPPALLGSSLQPWHALLAVASWLSAGAVPGLFHRLLGLAQAYHAHRPAFETSDVTVLTLRALFECVSNQYSELPGATLDTPADDDDDRHDGHDHQDNNDDDDDIDSNDDDDTKMKKAVRSLERNVARSDWWIANPSVSSPSETNDPPPLPRIFTFTVNRVLNAMRRLSTDQDWDIPPASLTPNLVGRLLGQLRLQPHRTALQRSWSLTPAGLARLARAYGLPVPSGLAHVLAAAAESSSSTTPP